MRSAHSLAKGWCDNATGDDFLGRARWHRGHRVSCHGAKLCCIADGCRRVCLQYRPVIPRSIGQSAESHAIASYASSYCIIPLFPRLYAHSTSPRDARTKALAAGGTQEGSSALAVMIATLVAAPHLVLYVRVPVIEACVCGLLYMHTSMNVCRVQPSVDVMYLMCGPGVAPIKLNRQGR